MMLATFDNLKSALCKKNGHQLGNENIPNNAIQIDH